MGRIAARARPAGQRRKSSWAAGVGRAAYRSGAACDLSEETRRVLALGFSCKTAIHPQQIPIIHAAFAPSPDELAWAKALLQAMPDGPTEGAFIFEGRMVDAPVLRKARRVVELASLSQLEETWFKSSSQVGEKRYRESCRTMMVTRVFPKPIAFAFADK